MTTEETDNWLKKHTVLARARDTAAYSMVGAVAAELFNYKKCHQPINAEPLRRAMDAYEAAQKKLDEFHAENSSTI